MCSYSTKRFDKKLKDFQKSYFLTIGSTNMSFLKTREDGAILGPHVALFKILGPHVALLKNVVLLLPQHERHFNMSG
jgi:hypothetical protein